MTIDSVVFDLDGTLWDTCAACAVAWNRVLARHAIPFREIVAEDVRRVTGRPHEECIRTVFQGVSSEHIAILARETAAEDNVAVAELGGELYPGVREGLARLGERFPLGIVSNCQAGYIETFLGWSGMGPLFRDFECWGRTGLPKARNLAALVERNGLRAPIYVGDTESDRAAARACAIPFAHVRYGFGKCDDHDLVADSFPELVEGLLSAVT